VFAHVAGIPVEEALLTAPALLATVTVIAGYVRADAGLLMGDTGLEPVTSALSRRRSPS
jgi:hypothetical protein